MATLSIGELARRTGLTVKTVRFYADRGIVPPAGRNVAGHRRYDETAVARLELVRTLRELGLDLATIRRVVDREATLAEVAAAHTRALDIQIRTLIDDFLGQVFGGLDGFDGVARSLTPQLPDDPEPTRLEAWIELAALARDPAFRDLMRLLAEQHAADRDPVQLRRDPVALVRDEATPALAAGVDPASPRAGRVVSTVLTRYPVRERLAAQLEAARDPRRERYLELLSTVNGWPAPERLGPVLGWFLTALRHR